MSDFCKVACRNYVECHQRLDVAVAEGRVLDAQEQAWSAAEQRLPERRAELVLQVTGLEFNLTLGDMGDNLDIDTAVGLPEDWTPGSPFMAKRYADGSLRQAQANLSDNERNHSIIPKELADKRMRQARNTQDIVALTQGVDSMERAEQGCIDGPKLSLLGMVRLKLGRFTHEVMADYMAPVDYNNSSSEKGVDKPTLTARLLRKILGTYRPESYYDKYGICSSQAGKVVLDQMPVPLRQYVPVANTH